MGGEQINVLLVEDERHDIRLIQAMLGGVADVHFDVKCAERLSVALDVLSKGGIDVVLLDLSLPDSHGLDTFMKVLKKAPEVPVVVMTGLDDQSIALQAVRRGAQDYLIKGDVDQGLLSRSLRYALERFRAEQRYKHSEERLRALLEHTSEGTLICGRDLKVNYASPSAERLFGVVTGGYVGTGAAGLIESDAVARVTGILKSLLKTPGGVAQLECRSGHADGSRRWIEVTARNLLDDPAVGGIAVIARDVTERKMAGEIASEGEKNYREVVERASDGITILQDTMIKYVNPRATDILGYAPEEMAGTPMANYIHPEELPKVIDRYTRRMAGEKLPQVYETVLLRKDGTGVDVELNAGLIMFDGEPADLVMVRDISERKRSQEALQVSEVKLKEMVEKLRLSQEALSTPVVRIWDNVLAMPLIGVVDEHRAEKVMEVLLNHIVTSQSELVILDVTGVTSMNTEVANYVMQTVRSASLLGARCVLTGMQPDVAQTVTELGLDMNKVIFKKDMRAGLRWALSTMGYEVRNGESVVSGQKSVEA